MINQRADEKPPTSGAALGPSAHPSPNFSGFCWISQKKCDLLIERLLKIGIKEVGWLTQVELPLTAIKNRVKHPYVWGTQ